MQYVNLYVESEYSLLKSSLKIDDLITFALENHEEAIAITDCNNMHGVIKFYQKCKANNIKPIIGLKLVLESKYYEISIDNSIILLSKNNNGYQNLLKLTSLRNIKKELFITDIKEYLDDLIVILPNEENELIKLYNDKNKSFVNALNDYRDIKDLYIGLDLQTLDMKKTIDDKINFFSQYNFKMVAINKSNYLLKEDSNVYKVLRCIGNKTKDYVLSEKESSLNLISNQYAKDLFRKYPRLIEESYNIMKMCNVEIEFGKYKMPVYTLENNQKIDTSEYLKDLAVTGLKKRLLIDQIDKKEYQKYIDRLLYELNTITKMGFCDYFLIVYDFIKYSKKENILVGPGRGSGPSSLVAYSLGITELDPLKYDLLFERFLNVERISMPDIDTDFPDNSRSDVIKYMMRRFGKKRVAHICTFGTYGPNSAIRDIARVCDLKNAYLDDILKHISGFSSFKEVLKYDEIYKRMYEEDEVIKYVTDIALKIENLPKNTSVHAAGIIMADKDLVNYTPLEEGMNGLYQTQFEAEDLEKLGLVKIDFLGLRNLTIIEKILKLIKLNTGKTINIYKLPLQDSATYKLIASGDTNGVFQLESNGMKNTLKKLKTSEFSDIVNAVALYRPGPMEMIDTFVRRKLGLEKINYIHEDLRKILEPTYGIIVYQEQILQIANKFAGYTLGEADVLRRAVSKKKVDVLSKQREKFIKGSIQLGHDEKTANLIFDYILKFANYGFNKSHSVAYSLISYYMAYLKTHYFKEFMTVMMSEKIGSVTQIKSGIFECLLKKIEVVIPNINFSGQEFVYHENKIYYPLQGINGLNELTINNILQERKNGKFTSYDEFISRTKEFLNKKQIESLINSGALDDFKISRKAMLEEYEQSLQLADFGDAFKGSLSTHIFSEEEYSYEKISELERLSLGFNLKFDVFRRYENLKLKYKTKTLDIGKSNYTNKNQYFLSIVMFKNTKEINTKNGDKMAFGVMYDNTSEIDCVLFPNVYKLINPINYNKAYIIEAKIENKNKDIQAVVNKINIID